MVRLYVWRGTFEQRTVADMRAAGVDVAAFAAVADFQTLALSDATGLTSARAFEPGEAWASYRRQIDNLNALVASGLVQRIDRPRSEEHTYELQSLMRISYAVFCLKK